MTSLAQTLSGIVGTAFEAAELPPELGLVRAADRPDLAQFQCNGAMTAAKQAGKNPREVAQLIVDALKQNPAFAKVEIAGPGFINLNVTDEFLSQFLSQTAADPRLGVAQKPHDTVVLDYGGPNIAKPMHVGHLRSSIIGDSLRRIALHAGYNAIGDVHMGDWGTQMGMILSELELRGTLGQPVSMQDLEEIYPTAAEACKVDKDKPAEEQADKIARRELALAATVKLQNGDPVYRAAWQQFIDVSIAGMKENFDALGVHFDLWKGEASSHPFIAPMVEDLKAKGLAQESDGALVVPVTLESDKKEKPPLILYKRDGAVMYGTTDLATIVERVGEYHPVKIVYVVDQRQADHFVQVFRAARLSGIAPDSVELTHAGFGTMNGTDGKPFKTREGGVMKLEDLIGTAVEKAQARLKDVESVQALPEAERNDIAKKVGIAAIKFADLQNQRHSDYVFDLDRMTSFEGKTGPYLLYQAVRIKALFEKAAKAGIIPGPFVLTDADRPLALLLTEMPDAFEAALKNYTPHVLCDYVYRLSQAFSSFYAACPILPEKDEALRASRLALCVETSKRLETTLDLLGIQVPERM